jgi:hypothetical protein
VGTCPVRRRWTNFLKEFGIVLNQSIEVVARKFLRMCFCNYHCFDGFNKKTALFVSSQSICDRKYSLYSSTSTWNGKREFQSEFYVFFLTKYIHLAQTWIFQTTLQKLSVILYSIHPFWFYLRLQYEHVHVIRNTFHFFKNLLHSERGQDIYYNGFTFYSTTWKLFLLQTSQRWGCTIHGSKGMLCFIVWNANSPSSAAICLHSSVIVSLVK